MKSEEKRKRFTAVPSSLTMRFSRAEELISYLNLFMEIEMAAGFVSVVYLQTCRNEINVDNFIHASFTIEFLAGNPLIVKGLIL